MTTLHHLPNNIVAIEGLPEGACDFQLDYPLNESYLFFDGIDFAGDSVELEYGTKYKILGWSDDEGVADQVVSHRAYNTISGGRLVAKKMYRNYPDHIYGGISAVESLSKLLHSVGCESERVLLLKEAKND